MATVNEFRTNPWTNFPQNAWTTVQGSSAWPVSAATHIKSLQKTSAAQAIPQKSQSYGNPTPTTPPTTTFQWSSSWDPVVPVERPNVKNIVENIPIMPSKGSKSSVVFEEVSSETLSSSDENEDESEGSPSINGVKTKKKKSEEKQLIEEELSKQNLYKTELCRSFCETGVCRYGHKCQFAHGEHELRPVMRHPKYKTETCKTFSNTGTCPYGNRCRFIHPGMWNSNWEEINEEDYDPDVHNEPTLAIQPPQSARRAIPIVPSIPVHQLSAELAAVKISGSTANQSGFLEKESDTINEEDGDAKPRLAFFQNLTVL